MKLDSCITNIVIIQNIREIIRYKRGLLQHIFYEKCAGMMGIFFPLCISVLISIPLYLILLIMVIYSTVYARIILHYMFRP
jgi:hypothetical protein